MNAEQHATARRKSRNLGFQAWDAVDWSKTNSQIVCELGVSYSTVGKRRRKAEQARRPPEKMTLAVVAHDADPTRRKFLGHVFAKSLRDGVDAARRDGHRGSLRVMPLDEAKKLLGEIPDAPQPPPATSPPMPVPASEDGITIGSLVRLSAYGAEREPRRAGALGEVVELTQHKVRVLSEGVALLWPRKYWELASK